MARRFGLERAHPLIYLMTARVKFSTQPDAKTVFTREPVTLVLILATPKVWHKQY